jgi:hypothetical protein
MRPGNGVSPRIEISFYLNEFAPGATTVRATVRPRRSHSKFDDTLGGSNDTRAV